MVVVSLSIPDELLSELDSVLGEEWYASRSEVIRQAVRKYISEYRQLEAMEGEVVATITVLYEKVTKDIELTHIQHEYQDIITTYLHSHLTEKSCLEVMVVKGPSERLRRLIDGLKSNRRVEQIKFSVMSMEIKNNLP
ncbi:MAG: nickel-responsive transcriptional regulator NikR [Candidatus Methanomethylicia archaeon]|nr:nickel-responsive transcriptional regulator NikR [Candidatus Methanomethylicia archaeon]